MPFAKFLILTTFGTIMWDTVLTYLGNIMGENYTKVVDIINNYSHIVLVISIIIFIVCIIYFYKKK